jgi:hypothetical protein
MRRKSSDTLVFSVLFSVVQCKQIAPGKRFAVPKEEKTNKIEHRLANNVPLRRTFKHRATDETYTTSSLLLTVVTFYRMPIFTSRSTFQKER